MKVLVVGATGATGRLLVEQLLTRGCEVRAIVRSRARLPEFPPYRDRLTVIEASLLELGESELIEYTGDCDAIASCLGHNLNLKGIFGRPRRLVRDATERLCQAVKKTDANRRTKFILMNTTGNLNRNLDEKRSLGEKMVLGLIRLLVPPQPDNEQAAEFLRTQIGRDDPRIEWAAVRPDSLIDETEVTPYEIHPSPIRSPIFNAGKTARINVAHFMAELILNDETWGRWRGQMPVIYNAGSPAEG